MVDCKQLLSAAERGDLTAIEELLKIHGCDVNVRDYFGNTPLHLAAFFGHERVVETLLQVGANVNAENNIGETPLHYAVFGGHKDIVERLINARANVAKKSREGKTPYDLAKQTQNGEIIDLLTSAYAKELDVSDVIDDEGRTIIDEALEKGYPELLEKLLMKRYKISP